MLNQASVAVRVLEDGETWTTGDVKVAFLTQEQFKFLCEDSSISDVVSSFNVPMTNLELAFANLIAEILSNPENSSLARSLSISEEEIDDLYDKAMFLVRKY
jgi:hypothetical protein